MVGFSSFAERRKRNRSPSLRSVGDHNDHGVIVGRGVTAPGGRLLSITSEGPFFREDQKSKQFRDFVDQHGYSEQLPEESFKGLDAFREAGVRTRFVVLEK